MALLALAVVVALVVVVRALDRPWLKMRLQAMVHQKSGLDVDWTATHVALFSGLRIERLVVATPPALRATAPELARLDGVTVSWTARSLVGGAPRFGALAIESLALTLVRDAAGRTSLSTIEPHGEKAPAAAPVPPSRAAAAALDGAPPIGRIDVAHATVTVVADAPDRPRERLRVGGLALHATLARDGGGFAIALRLGERAAPLVVDVTRTRDGVAAGDARAKLVAEIAASPAAASARIELDVERQTLAPATPVKEAARVEASARFGDGRVRVEVRRTRLGDGAATLEAEGDLPDAGPPRLERADGEIDLPRLLALVPSSLVPVEAERARLRYSIAGGSGLVAGELGRLRITQPGGVIVVEGGKLTGRVTPDQQATSVHAILPLKSLSMPGIAADDVRATVDAKVAADWVVNGDVGVRVAAARVGGATKLSVRDAVVSARVNELRINRAQPIATTGLVTASARLGSVDAVHGATHAVAEGLFVVAVGHLRGEPPYDVDADLSSARLRLSSAGRTLVDSAARIKLQADDVVPDAIRPRRTRAKLHAAVDVGALALALDADKAPDAVDFKLHADAASLALLRPLVPPDAPVRAPWDKMSLALASDGRVEHFAQPALREHTTLALGHAAFEGAGGSVAADRLELESTSSGSLAKHDVALELRMRALRVDGAAQGDTTLSVRGSWDGAAERSKLHVATSGDKGPLVALDAALGFDRAHRAVTYDVDGKAARLGSLAPLAHGGLAGFDFDGLAVELKGAGSLAGLVHDVDAHGRVHVAPDPLRTLAADGTLDLAVDGLDWSRGDRELSCGHARWHAVLATGGAGDGARRLVHGTLTVDNLTLDVGDHELVLRDVRDDIDGSVSGDLRAGVAQLDHHLAIRRVSQDLLRQYRLGDVTLDIKAHRDADGIVHIGQLALGNRVAGTTLALSGALDAGGERRSLSLSGELSQDLSRLWGLPLEMQGAGRASVQLRVDSGDLRVYHTLAAVRVAGATIKLPHAGVTIESMDGEIPITADLVLDAGGMHLLRETRINSYSELRFADQHPLLSRHSFVTAARVVTPLLTIAPIAGNLRVDDNIVALNQLELGVRGGRVTGLCIVDWRDDGATVQLRVRASDVRSSHGEPFDGNSAVIVSTKDRTVEGRAEILRIGKRHLYDLLDLDDPHHADAAVNRVRRALTLGYPDHVRLTFKHGFADAKIEFGGLARLVRVDELRGIPMGPLIDRVLAPLSRKQEDEEP